MKRQHDVDVNTPERYDEIYFGERTNQLHASPFLMNLIKMMSHGSSLDIGCGLGRYFPAFNGAITGLDFTQKVLDQAKKDYPYANIVNQDIAKNGLDCFGDNTFDFILCSEVLEHMQEPQKIVDEMHRVLKPNGICISATPYLDRIVCEEHLWEYDWHDLTKMFIDFKRSSVARFFNVPSADWEHLAIIAQK